MSTDWLLIKCWKDKIILAISWTILLPREHLFQRTICYNHWKRDLGDLLIWVLALLHSNCLTVGQARSLSEPTFFIYNTHLLIHLSSNPSTQAPTYSSIYLPNHPSTHPSIHPFTYLSNKPSIHLSIHPFLQIIQPWSMMFNRTIRMDYLYGPLQPGSLWFHKNQWTKRWLYTKWTTVSASSQRAHIQSRRSKDKNTHTLEQKAENEKSLRVV